MLLKGLRIQFIPPLFFALTVGNLPAILSILLFILFQICVIQGEW